MSHTLIIARTNKDKIIGAYIYLQENKRKVI